MGELRIAIYFLAWVTTFAAVIVGVLAALPAIWRTRRTRIILAVVAVVLLIPLLASVFWPVRFGPNAPVSQAATLYVNGADCSFASSTPCGFNAPTLLYGFSGADGSERWRLSLPAQHADPISAFPLVAHTGVVYTFVPTKFDTYGTIHAGMFMAIRGADGKVLWQTSVNLDVRQLLYDNGQLIAYGYDQVVNVHVGSLLIDAATGRTLATTQLPANMTPLAYGDGALYVCVASGSNETRNYTSVLAAWSVAAAKQLWRRPVGACGASHVSAVSQGVLYLNNYGDNGLSAVRESDGALLWQALPVASYANSDVSIQAITVGDGVALVYKPTYIAGGHGLYRPMTAMSDHDHGAAYTLSTTLLAFNAADGKPLWDKTLDSPQLPMEGALSPPVIVGSTVLVSGDSLTALRVSDGATLWRFSRTLYDITVIGVSGQVIFTAESYVKPPNSITVEQNFTLDYLDAHSLANGAQYWERNQYCAAAISEG